MKDKILVVNGTYYANVVEGLGDIVEKTKLFLNNPDKFKLVVFTGGADVSPSLYGDTSPNNVCGCSIGRDIQETEIFKCALYNNVKMTGICRGLQFLNVMSGGKMMHHISGHEGTIHEMSTLTGESLLINSYHHQMILPNKKAKVIGWAKNRLSKVYIGAKDELVHYDGKECEAAIFPETKAFGVQYHPEVADKQSDAFIYYRSMVVNALELSWKDFISKYTEKGKYYLSNNMMC